MTHENIIDLQEYLQNITGYMTYLGLNDIAGDAYPVIQLIFDQDNFTLFKEDNRAVTIDDPIGIKVIVEKKNELDAFRIRDLILKKIGQFQENKGHVLIEDGTKEYTDNTFELTIVLALKNILHDTE